MLFQFHVLLRASLSLWQPNMKITSRENSLLRRARAVRDARAEESIYVEGLRLCEEALSSGLEIEAVIYSDEIELKERAASLIEKLRQASANSASVSEKLLASISYTRTPQGIVVLAKRPANDQKAFESKQPSAPFLVVIHGINNPVNVGAILRTAEAAGVTGAIATANTSDPFSPKALRGAMGSAFRLPIWSGVSYKQVIAWCNARNIRVICADADGQTDYTELDWCGAIATIVGAESAGLLPEEVQLAGDVVRIPMKGLTESLNVSVATGILLYQAARQRTNQ